jgi:cytochrome bd-type quinol oxidase subunit 2
LFRKLARTVTVSIGAISAVRVNSRENSMPRKMALSFVFYAIFCRFVFLSIILDLQKKEKDNNKSKLYAIAVKTLSSNFFTIYAKGFESLFPYLKDK